MKIKNMIIPEINISREEALRLLVVSDETTPFMVMCKGYACEDDDYVEVGQDDMDTLADCPEYDTFQVWIK